MYQADEISQEILDQLPDPVGYRILIALPKVEEKTKGGVYMPDDLRKREETATMIGCVLKMGPDCYRDPDRFPSGAYCRENDWVIIRSYAGTRFKVKGQEFRLINDDVVEGVVSDPRGIERT